MKRKFTAFLLAALLVLVLVPSGVFADVNVTQTYGDSHYKITTTAENHAAIGDNTNSLDITKAGTYTIEMEAGITSSDARLYVNIGDNEEVTLIIKGITINANQSINGYGIFITNAGTANIQIDGKNIVKSDGNVNSEFGIYAACSLNITGTGSLNISGTEYNGIYAYGDLIINDSEITLTNIGLDGFTAVYAEGNIDIEKSTITIDNCGANGISADRDIDISGSTIDIDGVEEDGILVNYNLAISGSTIDIDGVEDDGIDVYENITISNSNIYIDDTGWDGIYADGYIDISDSNIGIDGVEDDGIDAYGFITISGSSEITINGAPEGAIFGRTIVLEDKLSVLEPTDAELIDFEWYGNACQTYVHAGESIIFDYDDDPANALGTIKIGKATEKNSFIEFMEWLNEIVKKLSILINYLNTGRIVIE